MLLAPPPAFAPGARSAGHYASVNGLHMYYEVHGRGRPLVLLHGALSTIESNFGGIVRALAATRQVIAIEQQAHGRTADVDRPLSHEQMADDSVELLRQLGIAKADFFGFSMGAACALEVAVRHPDAVRKLAVVSGCFSQEGFDREFMKMLLALDPEDEHPHVVTLVKEFERVGADPSRWPAAVGRIKQAFSSYTGMQPCELRGIRAETLIIGGSEGLCEVGHIREMSRLVPKSHLHLFSFDDHHPSIVGRSAAMLPGFLDTSLS